MTTTIVTMLFDLKNLKDASPATRPLDFYLERCVSVLRLPYPMLIFCDEVTYPYLKTIRDTEVTEDPNLDVRSTVGFGDDAGGLKPRRGFKTKVRKSSEIPSQYVIQRLETYDYYRHSWDIIEQNRKKKGTPLDTRNTSSYFLMGMFKPLALWIAASRQDFNTEYYAWIDIGCSHICRHLNTYVADMVERPHPNIAVCYIHYRSNKELESMEDYMKYGGPCGIASTAYTMPGSHVIPFYTLMFQIFYEKLFRGVGHTDETVMVYAYDRNPELFTLFYGDYGSIFMNYREIREDIATIVYCFVQQAQTKGRLDLAKQAVQALENSTSAEKSQFTPYLQGLLNL